jgi:LysM repeat protein
MSFFDRIADFIKDLVERDDHYEVTVVKGDSVWEIVRDESNPDEPLSVIADRVKEVCDLNGLDEHAAIHPDQKLKLPKHWAE